VEIAVVRAADSVGRGAAETTGIMPNNESAPDGAGRKIRRVPRAPSRGAHRFEGLIRWYLARRSRLTTG